MEVVFRNKKMDWRTALSIAGNKGKTRWPATSRAARFFSFVQEPITLRDSCGCSDSIMSGDQGRYERVVTCEEKQKEKAVRW